MHAFIDKQIEQGRYPSFSTRRTFLPLRSLLCLTNHGTALSLLSHVLSGHWVYNIYKDGYGYGRLRMRADDARHRRHECFVKQTLFTVNAH